MKQERQWWGLPWLPFAVEAAPVKALSVARLDWCGIHGIIVAWQTLPLTDALWSWYSKHIINTERDLILSYRVARAAGRAWSAGQGARRCARARAPRQRPATEASAASGRRRRARGGAAAGAPTTTAASRNRRTSDRARRGSKGHTPTEPPTEPGQAAPPRNSLFF